MKNCFIVCPIGSDESETRKRSDKLYKHIIAPACEACGLEPIRIDKENTNGSLTEEIISHITNDALVIADITDANPNAFYEIGYRVALKKPLIQLSFKELNIPFDISTIRTFFYDFDLDAVEELKKRLIQTIKSIDFDNSNVDDKSSDTLSDNVNINAQILQEIYNIQDRIEKLSSIIENKDSAAISVLADKLASSNATSTEAVLFSKFMDNPQKFAELVQIAEKFPKLK